MRTRTHGFALLILFVMVGFPVAAQAQPADAAGDGSFPVSGHVALTSGSPMGGARILVQGEGVERTAVTDSNGWFEIGGLRPGTYRLTILSMEEKVLETRHLVVPSAPVSIVLTEKRSLRARVVESESPELAVQQFTVEVSSTGFRTPVVEPFEVSASDGRFTVDLAPGSYQVFVRAPGYLHSRPTIMVEETGTGEEAEILLRRSRVARGRVVDANGRPLAGVSVATFFDFPGGVSDEHGFWLLPQLPKDSLAATFRLDGYAPKKVMLPNSEEPIEIVMSEGKGIRGVVVDEEGSPLAGASIELRSRRGNERRELSADDTGGFTLSNLEGPHVLRVGKKGFHQVTEELSDGQTGPLRLVLKKADVGVVSGRVAGARENALLKVIIDTPAWRHAQMVSESAAYRVEEVSAGAAKVYLYDGKVGEAPIAVREVEVTKGGELRVDFDLAQVPLFRGRVTRNGTPLPEAKVVFRGEKGDAASAVTGREGEFEIRLSGTGKYSAFVSSHELAMPYPARFELPRESPLVISIVDRTVRGRVVDADSGSPLSGVQVGYLVGTAAGSDTLRTNAAGEFTIMTYADEKFWVTVQKDGYDAQSLEVDPLKPEQPVQFRLVKERFPTR